MNLDLGAAQRSLDETIETLQSLEPATLIHLAEFVGQMAESSGILWVIGNGGSASTGAHLACDVGKGVSSSRSEPIRSLSLNEQMTTQSAWANDFGFELALRNQLRELLRPGDAVLAISGSGNSPNVVHAARWAKSEGYPVAVLVGRLGGDLCQYADIDVRVDSQDMQVIENVHLAIVHWLYKALVSS